MNAKEEKTNEISVIDRLGRIALFGGLAKILGVDTIKRFVSYPPELKRDVLAPLLTIAEHEIGELKGFLGGATKEEIVEALVEFLTEDSLNKFLDAEDC